MSTPSHTTTRSLLADLADLQFSLNDSHRVASIASESALTRELSRDTLIGLPWLELVSDADRAHAATSLESAAANPGTVQKMDARLNIIPDREPVPVSCWICGDSDD